MLRRLLRIFIAVPLLFAAYAAVLCVPQPVFAFSVRTGNLELRSDRPLTDVSGARVLELARKKLERSPLYSASQTYRVFICNSRWRQVVFFNKDYGVGGVAPYPVTSNVFLRDANVDENRLISLSGKPVAGERTLDYFVAHEITHQLTGRALGPVRYFRLPQWVREGYADCVGKAVSFDYYEARRAFLANAPEMNWKKSGLYSRFHLLVAYLLDHQAWTVEQLLRNPPPQAEVEAAVAREP
jgi:hypothetical protein